ncbi:DUF881 domain-containing protein [Aeromicrobium sp. Leaf272]|uniref:DUF881 domain-containing protein n=1 Tax=Aeromicrobium sp. Leaf272 TaxID=1736317 RepID=UPI000A44B0C2|nr:DUF881 domain-containing protein [Aeromicrobium sp. Leaf272]
MSGSRARSQVRSRRGWSVAVLLVCSVAGLTAAAAHATSDGEDLRPAGGDIASLVSDRTLRVEQRQQQADDLQREIDDVLDAADRSSGIDAVTRQLRSLRDVAGLSTARGPGIRVTLDDAPRTAATSGVDPNYLVVHQQDLQAFVNALWAGGAEAVSLQGQRLVSTTAIVCVGSTVIIDGRPYSPPYVVEAIGDRPGMTYSLGTSPEVVNYERYVTKYRLGMKVESSDDLVIGPYTGTTALQHARPLA